MTTPVIDQPAIEVLEETDGEMRVRFPVVVLEGVDTSDGRFIIPGGLTHRALPMSVLALPESDHGGEMPGPAVVIGRIDTLVRTAGPELTSRTTGEPFPAGSFVWSGEGVIDANHPVAELVRRRFLRGVSVDLAATDVEVIEEEVLAESDNPRREIILNSAEIAAVTLVPIPAFGDCYVELADEPERPAPITADELPDGLAAAAVPSWRSAEIGDPVALVAAADGSHTGGMIALILADPDQLVVDGGDPAGELHLTLAYLGEDVTAWGDEQRAAVLSAAEQIAAGRGPVEADVMGHAAFNPTGANDREPCAVYLVSGPDLPAFKADLAEFDASDHPVFLPHITAGYGIAPDALSFVGPVVFDQLRVALGEEVTDFPLGEPTPAEQTERDEPLPDETPAEDAVVAAAAPRPPADWFADPGLDGPTALRVTEDGRVFGHAAAWNVPHLGMPGQHITAPRSASGYAYFATGAVLCDDGTEVPVGHITLDTGHAATDLGRAAAAAHYDHTGSVVADVAAGEDAHGIWVAGALRAGVDEATAAKLRASALSGDWRRVGGALEMVAVLAVNVPGFAVPRARSRVASGQPLALVAAGALRPIVDEHISNLAVSDTTFVSINAPKGGARIEIAGDGTVQFFRADGTLISLAQPVDLAGIASRDELVAAVEQRLEERRAAGELSAAHAALLDQLDDTPAVVAALLAEVDDTPGRVAELLAELDDDGMVSGMPPQLQAEWLVGEIGARIGWGTPGAMTRCIAEAASHDIPEAQRGGMCQNLRTIAEPGD